MKNHAKRLSTSHAVHKASLSCASWWHRRRGRIIIIIDSDITDSKEFLDSLKELYLADLPWRVIRKNMHEKYNENFSEHKLKEITYRLIDKGELKRRSPDVRANISYSCKVKETAKSLPETFTLDDLKKVLILTIHTSLSTKTLKTILAKSDWAEQIDKNTWRRVK